MTAQALTQDQIDAYWRDGFVVLPGFLSAHELAPLAEACRADPSIEGAATAIADIDGLPQEVVAYTELSDDMVGVIPRLARMVGAAEALVGRPVYHWHSKLSMKRPGARGQWNWHQDFGYWYFQGVLAPDMTSVSIAVDRCTVASGCMKLVRGSHRLGRLEHAKQGEASGTAAGALAEAMARLETVACELEPGDAVAFHCNTLHASGPNDSDQPRTIIHCSYNAADNAPFIAGQDAYRYRPIAVVADDALAERRFDTVFSRQQFMRTSSDTGYGYRVLRAPTRADMTVETNAVGAQLSH